MLFWRPHPESPLVFFAIAGLWGVGDAVWQTQINGKSNIFHSARISFSNKNAYFSLFFS